MKYLLGHEGIIALLLVSLLVQSAMLVVITRASLKRARVMDGKICEATERVREIPTK